MTAMASCVGPALSTSLGLVQVQQHRRVSSLKSLSFSAVARCSASSDESSPTRSIRCPDCDANGAKVCTQCKGGGYNTEDHFGGRFKTGEICWLCRGKKQILCGNCNGAGFLGGFLNSQDD